MCNSTDKHNYIMPKTNICALICECDFQILKF